MQSLKTYKNNVLPMCVLKNNDEYKKAFVGKRHLVSTFSCIWRTFLEKSASFLSFGNRQLNSIFRIWRKSYCREKKVIRENKTAIWTWTHLNILDYYFITVLKKKNTKTNQIFFFLKLGAMLLYILQGQTIKADSTFKTAERRIVSLAANSVLCMPAVRLKCMVLT